MNKSICMILLIICLIITMCGCIQSEKQPQQPTDGTEPSNTQLPTDLTEEEFKKTIVAVSVPTTTETTKAADGTILFQYTYQHISLILHRPAAADKVILDFLNRVDHTRESAEATRDMAKAAYNGDTNWVPYQHHITYSPKSYYLCPRYDKH